MFAMLIFRSRARFFLRGFYVFATLIFLMLPVYADENIQPMSDQEKSMASSIKSLLKNLRGMDVDSIEVHALKPFANLFEVVLDGEGIIYTNQDMTYFIQGRLLDGKTLTDLSALSLQKRNKVDIASLPISQAIKVIKGDGKRKLYTFEDPRCGYCKKLAHELKNMDNLTIHVFVVGFLGPESIAQGKAILCSDNPSEAWLQTMLENNPPDNAGDCSNPLDSNTSLARKLRVTGTPAILFDDGTRFTGYVPQSVLEDKFSKLEQENQSE